MLPREGVQAGHVTVKSVAALHGPQWRQYADALATVAAAVGVTERRQRSE
jgi:hypothetical protein